MSELERTVLAWEELLQTLGFRLISVLSLPRILGVLALVSALTAQVAEHQTRIGLPQDWTHNHVVFHRQLLSQHPELAAAEPRVLHQFVRSMPYSPIAVSSPSDGAASSAAAITRDWNANLGGGKVVLGMSPIKFGFDVNASPSCTNDFVAFGLDAAGTTGGQGNLVALNNLYRTGWSLRHSCSFDLVFV